MGAALDSRGPGQAAVPVRVTEQVVDQPTKGGRLPPSQLHHRMSPEVIRGRLPCGAALVRRVEDLEELVLDGVSGEEHGDVAAGRSLPAQGGLWFFVLVVLAVLLVGPSAHHTLEGRDRAPDAALGRPAAIGVEEPAEPEEVRAVGRLEALSVLDTDPHELARVPYALRQALEDLGPLLPAALFG